MRYLIFTITLLYGIHFTSAQKRPSYASTTFSFSVSDLEQSAKWYKKVLGNMENFSPAEGVLEFQLNETTWLQLFEGELAKGAILRLEVQNIKSQNERLEKLGISPTSVESVPEVVSFFDFKDPDGNQLSFYQLASQ